MVKPGSNECSCGHQQRAEYVDQRDSASARGYDARWRRLRVMYLRTHPLCVDPDTVHAGQPVPATDVDHIVAKRAGGSDRWENLQALCHSCHSHKTVREQVGGG